MERAEFQFTPLREGRPGLDTRRQCARPISIHAPPRGATILGEQVGGREEDFNSRPSARGDLLRVRYVGSAKNFNSRPSARGDCSASRSSSSRTEKFQFTPLREGRPVGGFIIFVPPSYFNSRRHHLRVRLAFQFTPLREGRQNVATWLIWRGYFNSRPSARGDHQRATRNANQDISIHAPPRGATS